MQSLCSMADDDDVVCPLPALRKVSGRAIYTTERRARTTARVQSTGPLPLPHARDPFCRAPLTRDRPQACEPRCADVFKHYLACADRIEQKGAGTAAASEISPRVAAQPLAAHIRHRRDRTTKKTRRRLRALLLRLAQVHRQVRDAAHHAEAQVVLYKYLVMISRTYCSKTSSPCQTPKAAGRPAFEIAS